MVRYKLAANTRVVKRSIRTVPDELNRQDVFEFKKDNDNRAQNTFGFADIYIRLSGVGSEHRGCICASPAYIQPLTGAKFYS